MGLSGVKRRQDGRERAKAVMRHSREGQPPPEAKFGRSPRAQLPQQLPPGAAGGVRAALGGLQICRPASGATRQRGQRQPRAVVRVLRGHEPVVLCEGTTALAIKVLGFNAMEQLKGN